MNKIFIYLSATAILLLLFSCEEKTTWDIRSSDTFAVADCILTNELKQQEVSLYSSAGKLNEKPVGVSAAVIEVSDGSQTVNFIEDGNRSGKYISAIPFRATVGQNIQVNGKPGQQNRYGLC